MPTLAQALQSSAGPTSAGGTLRVHVGAVTAVTATTMTVAAPGAPVVARIVRTGITPVIGDQALVIDQPGTGKFGLTLA